MNIRDLQYIVAVAETGHFSHAAERCNVSQSTLSIQVKKLEDILGAQIFERTNKRVMVTDIGHEIITKAVRILHEAESIKELAKSVSNPLTGEVMLGAFPTIAPYLLPLCTANIKAALPSITLQLVEEKTAQLQEMLLSGGLDCAIIAAPVGVNGCTQLALFEEPFVLAVPKTHALAKKKKISDETLASLSLLLLDEGHCMRAQALEICHSIGSNEAKQFRATSIETLRQMVSMGQAVTLMPKLAVQPSDSIAYIPLENKSFKRTLHLVWRESSARGVLFQKLAEIIRASIK